MIDTLISYRIDRPAPNLLRVRLRQWPMIAMLILMCVALMGIPLGFTVDALNGKDALANLNGQHGLAQAMAMLGLAMLSLAGPAGLWLWPVRESLLLSRQDQMGWRVTRNVFGRRRRVSDTFSLVGIRGLQVRQGKIGDRHFLEPVLVDQEGEPHRLSFESALLKPGSARANDYLAALADFFGKPWPEPVTDIKAWERLMQQLKPRVRPSKGKPLPLPADAAVDAEPPPISWPLRITLGVVGVFFGMVTLNNVFAVLAGVFSGRLVTSGSRFSHTTSIARFAEAPVWFVVNVLFETLGVLFLASITYGCLRTALRAPNALRNRQAERDSASVTRERKAALPPPREPG